MIVSKVLLYSTKFKICKSFEEYFKMNLIDHERLILKYE